MYSVRIIGINRRIIEWAKSVFMITAISQNGKLDTVSVLYMNYKMIEDVIMASGFRPTRQQLFRQYVNILVTSIKTYLHPSSAICPNKRLSVIGSGVVCSVGIG